MNYCKKNETAKNKVQELSKELDKVIGEHPTTAIPEEYRVLLDI